ncbi:hypothetical protein [Acidiferrobacter sp.]|jgi:hypothetical protein|uniref:hypothetical protein n=1 Tax=Acidiferrobacter sp. TaxID=1872107 RepID=UPI0026242A37|nr:hypothetical protein [Acidiferrobacter sp.]
MKSIKVTDVGQIKNELNKYRLGKKLEIRQFNQAARLAWLGKVTLMPLDPEDPETRSYLLYIDYPDGLSARIVDVDEDLVGRIFILDGEQATFMAEIVEQGVHERAALYEDLNRRDFYFGKFYTPGVDEDEAGG